MHKKLALTAIAALTLAGSFASRAGAEDKPVAWYDKVKVSGFVDAYYQINFNGLSGGLSGNINNPASTSQRALDVRQNEFSLNGAKFSAALSDTPTGVGGQVDLLFGPMGVLSSGGGPIEQAFVTYGLGPVSIKFGKFVTHLSFEVIDTPANWNYSRSILFTEVPFYHVGVCGTYSPFAGLSAMLGVDNGNSIDQANDEAKDIMAQLNYSAITNLSLYLNYYLEANRAATTSAPFENTHYLELVGTYQSTPVLNLGLDYLYKTTLASSDKDSAGNALGTSAPDFASGKLLPFSPKSQGYALYVNYTTPVAGLSVVPRFEQWYAPDASSFADDYTLTLKYAVGPLTHYLELRSDVEGPAGFNPSAGQAELKTSQQTLTYAVTYSF